MNYSTLIFCEIILSAINQKDNNLDDYLTIFNNVEDLSVKETDVKITLWFESSYKGGEKLDIDYSKLSQEIIQIKKIYPSMNIYTKLGMS